MNESTAASLISEDAYKAAIMDFQRFAGINETGIVFTRTPQINSKLDA